MALLLCSAPPPRRQCLTVSSMRGGDGRHRGSSTPPGSSTAHTTPGQSQLPDAGRADGPAAHHGSNIVELAVTYISYETF